jgi:hypothetical protein
MTTAFLFAYRVMIHPFLTKSGRRRPLQVEAGYRYDVVVFADAGELV